MAGKKSKSGISPAMQNLLEYLKETGVIAAYKVQHTPKYPGLGIGSLRDDQVVIMAENPTQGDATAAHEITHALVRSGKKGRTERIEDLYNKLPFFSRDTTVYPSSWEAGNVAMPLTHEGWYGKIPPTGRTGGRLQKMYSESADNFLNKVMAGIPEDESWSGLRRKEAMGLRPYEEAVAYHHTSEELADIPNRARNFGRLLFNYGVPDRLVLPAVESLSKTKPSTKGYSGGGKELDEMHKALLKEWKERNAKVAP